MGSATSERNRGARARAGMAESVTEGEQPDTARRVVGTTDGEEAARIRERLARLGDEKAALKARLAELEVAPPKEQKRPQPKGRVSNRSPAREKIMLFRSLFRGRADVFPQRWENTRKGKVGYAPACGNEWKPGLCDKPRIKCVACSNQAFLAVTDEVIDGHLRGRHTSASTPWFPTIPVGFWPRISTGGLGGGMPRRFSQPAGRRGCRWPWNGRVRVTAATSGFSSRNRSRPGSRDVSARTS